LALMLLVHARRDARSGPDGRLVLLEDQDRARWDVELIAERMRTRFSSYLRQEARGAIELRCRDAVAEHTNWLVRQVTRDVVTALEAEVANWVRDAVREELARHESQR